ncbi:MAG: molybdate ABC transporter permease subunit [Crocinitomicaceae bacterium]
MDFAPFYVTFKLATLTTIILFIIGVPLGYFMAFSRWRGRVLLESVLMLPIVLPPTVLGFYFLQFLGPSSSFGEVFESIFGFSLAFTFPGILLGSLIFCTPFMLTPIINGFRGIPKNMIESTYLLKKSRWSALWYVYLPFIRKNLLNGILLTFAHTIGEFGLVLMIGGKMTDTNVASVAIYDEMNAMNYDKVHVYAAILLIISFVLILSLLLFTRKSNQTGVA